jgi:hypothetical protein
MTGSVSLAHVHGEGKRPDSVIVLVPRRQVNFACDIIALTKKHDFRRRARRARARSIRKGEKESGNGERTDQQKLAETPCSPPTRLGLARVGAIKFKNRVYLRAKERGA